MSPVHPQGPRARLLLTSVFGPYARDDEFGSRRINPMELYHNQITRMQGPFSLRMFHRSWGIMMIQANLANPSTLLDFPTQERFRQELVEGRYDVVGISSIIPNWRKVQRMCQMVRQHSPGSQIVVGGHVTSIPDLEQRIDADHIVRGEGIAWMRRYLGQDPAAPVAHPDIVSGFGSRIMGLPLRPPRAQSAATLIPSVGCPMGCNFCATSSLFGGKGKFVDFYSRGEELFSIMCGLEERLGTRTFFIMDENFLLHRRRALELLELMERGAKPWSLYAFSSAHALSKYSIDELVRLGLSWIWMGLEGEGSQYAKLKGVDTREMVRELRAHGIRVVGSSIIGLEHHTPDNIDAAIDYAVSHNTDFHQFMLYTPLPGTPLYQEHAARGDLLDVDLADVHGQYRFNWRHPHISREDSEKFLLRAFVRDFEVNGPSLARVAATLLAGWRRYKDHSCRRVVERFRREVGMVRNFGSAILWAAQRHLEDTGRRVAAQLARLRGEVAREFGWMSRWTGPLLGPFILWSLAREARRLERGLTFEPPTFVERKNWA
ncbi:MAG TPA: cobalamin-dependent protein [Candidatus Nitrosotenuis sp.]|jgi:radical SAM superfamily enzyme YgiQ (UPF0313 family)|nr:cobalamin-dependent protein [Candidatus Nitrosotenuis sp.]